jgi:hypothetical protein
MTTVRRLVIDVLKPHEPPLIEFTQHVSEVEDVTGVTTSLIELDKEVQNVKLTLEGEGIEFDAIEAAIEEFGGTVHSIDQVACGAYAVEDRETPQDA